MINNNTFIKLMKNLLLAGAAFILLTLASCTEEKKIAQPAEAEKIDSLERVVSQKDNEINDMLSTLNEIQDGFRAITEAENRVSVVKDGERSDKAEQIRENISFISNTMKRNRELIAKLRQQARESSVKSEQMKQTIENLVSQLEEKNAQLQQLRAELDAKDIHIAELNENINNLNTNVTNLQTENNEKSQTINTQDKQLHTAWYVFGTKKELKDQRILEGDRVLQANFNKSYFTKIDIRVDKEIKLYSKSARILTTHPSSSYTLVQDANKQYILRINNPQLFWSTSKYLVVVVK